MIRLADVKLPYDHDEEALRRAVLRRLRIPAAELLSLQVQRISIDARHKPEILLVYTVDAAVRREERAAWRAAGGKRFSTDEEEYTPPPPGREILGQRPVVIGFGPAGMFAALLLARRGYRPLVLERGREVEARAAAVRRFWDEGVLDPENNVQFGEGGAGTFSDGKLTTLIRDPRCRVVLREMAAAGAPADILVRHKPHVGSDRLRTVVQAIRRTIQELGGEVWFGCRVEDLAIDDRCLRAVVLADDRRLPAAAVVLAPGHSARDTFAMLRLRELRMEPKPFALGVRVEHAQRLIDTTQYGAAAGHPRLGAAEYKLVYHDPGGRSAYTFCMCPGGWVIAAASTAGQVVTNGMSDYARAGENANSALLVGVSPADFPSTDPLAGVEFQRVWEEAAFRLGGGDFRAPLQTVGSFLGGTGGGTPGAVRPTYHPGVTPADLGRCLPEYVTATLRRALPAFDRQMPGFAAGDALLTGVETRSSSPVRLLRDESGEGSIGGVFPAGEGAGYAGGIVSAAVDGMRAAEALIRRFAPPADGA